MRIKKALVSAIILAAAAVWWIAGAAQGGAADELRVKGAALTMLERGTGEPDFAPVLTRLAFYWSGQRGQLECLALAPGAAAGAPGSGEFTVNAMYVTGPVTSASRNGSAVILEGIATVTGIGAGENLPFRLVAHEGGPGTRVVLEVSGLTFREIVLEGEVGF